MLRRSVLIFILVGFVAASFPRYCGQNEEWRSCLSACGDGCDLLFTKQACTMQCLPAGCTCMPNHHRHSVTGLCVPDSECPKPEEKPCVQCDHPLEEFYTTNGCMEMCSDRRMNVRCGNGPGFDRQGCYCKKGYCRDSNHECVNEQQNSGVCMGPNEAYLLSNTCQNNCPIPGTAVKCGSKLTPDCYCDYGFCRMNKQCVRGRSNGPQYPIGTVFE